MKIEIINKPMLCWDENEREAVEVHVLAKVHDTKFPYKTVITSNSKSNLGEIGMVTVYKHAKPLPEVVELTVEEISKLLGKTVKVVK